MESKAFLKGKFVMVNTYLRILFDFKILENFKIKNENK